MAARMAFGIFALLCIGTLSAQADNIGNVAVSGSGSTCGQIRGTYALKFDQLYSSDPNTILDRLTITVVEGQPQYVVETISQVSSASTGTAQLYNNGFLGKTGAFVGGTWSGVFPTFDPYGIVSFGPFTITTGTGSTLCVLKFTNGQAIY